MPTLKFTENSLREVACPERGKQFTCWDERTKGFGLRVSAGAKTFIARSRLNGKLTQVTIGDFETMAVEEARLRAEKILVGIHDGLDPNQQKAFDRARSLTVEECFEDYLKWKANLSTKTVEVYRDAMDRRLSDWYGLRLAEINRTLVRQRYKEIIDDVQKSAGERNDLTPRTGHAEASLVFRLLSSLFNFAEMHYEDKEGKPLYTGNPVKCLSAIKKNWRTVPRRQTVILPGELKAFYEGVQLLRSNTARDFLMLLILTGFRLNEATQLMWSEVNLAEGFIMLPPNRTKNKRPHLLPLSDYLLDLLKRRKENNHSDFVFPSSHEGCAYFTDPKRAITAVSKHMNKRFSAHDCRRTFVTVAESLELSPYALKALLNHSTSDVTAGYIVSNIERLREPMQRITNHILNKMQINSSGSAREATESLVWTQ